MKRKGLIAFDIDGTLTHRLDWIDPKVVEKLDYLRKDGWQLAFVTGRIFSFAWKILQHFPFPYILSVQNGADIVEMPTMHSLGRHYLPASILPHVEKMYEGQKEDFIVYAGIEEGDFCYYRPEKYSPKMLDYLEKLKRLSKGEWKTSNFEFAENQSFSLIKCFGEESAMRRLHDTLRGYKGIEVSILRDPIDPSLFLNLITHPFANKGNVVHFLRKHFEEPFVIAAGDEHNDLKMLEEANVAIAIETAPEEVLKHANIIAKPADQLGILDAIEEAIKYAGR